MAEGDPFLGKPDTWRGDLVSLSTEEDTQPTLYHGELSYFSMIARLALEEEGVEYTSRHIDYGDAMEHLAPWFLKISPKGLVPVLVYKGKSMVESRDIALFVAEKVSSKSLLLPAGEERERVLDLVERHYKLEVEKLTYGTMLQKVKLMAMLMPRKYKGAIKTLEELKKSNPDLVELLDKKIEQKKNQLKILDDPQKAKETALVDVGPSLDQLKKNLEKWEFLCGPEYSLGDVMFTCFLARLSMIGMLEEMLTSRPRLALWWAKVKERESFAKAGIVSTQANMNEKLRQVKENLTPSWCSVM